jgi:hypothetical protein
MSQLLVCQFYPLWVEGLLGIPHLCVSNVETMEDVLIHVAEVS